MTVTRLRPPAPSLADAVDRAITALTLTPADAGAVQLARQYAATIDAADNRADALEKLGPKLLTTLEALGATPAARARVTKAATGKAPVSQLGKLRDARHRKA